MTELNLCPICAEPFKAGDMCATDIELGTCHAGCLEGAPTVDLDTGEPVEGPIPTYRYDEDANLSQPQAGEPVAWESTTPAYRQFITDKTYQAFSPDARRWYKPYRCSNCASPPALAVKESDSHNESNGVE